jgi:N-acetylglutamate synthase-like GNAT family acetyltransferase
LIAKLVTKKGISFRPARTGEMPFIRALLRLYPEQLAQQNLPRVSSFLVATAGGRIVGCCALQIYSKRLAEVRSLAVHPDFQQRRIASQLVELCKQRARARGVKELFAVTSQTSFFGRAGFATFRREKMAMFFEVNALPLQTYPKA